MFCLLTYYTEVKLCIAYQLHIHLFQTLPHVVAMKKVYLEKRSLAEHSTTVDLGDLEDLDLFLHNELENYSNTTGGFLGQAITSSHMQPVHSSVLGDHRPSVIVENAKDELEVSMLLDPAYDLSSSGFDLMQASDLSSPSDSSPLLSSTSTCHLRTSSPPPSHQESSPATSPTPGQLSHTSTNHSTSSPSTSRSKTGRKPQSLSSGAERKVYPCQHSGCGKKYTKLSHLKVFFMKHYTPFKHFPGPHARSHWGEAIQLSMD